MEWEGSDIEKLIVLMEYWANHNLEHMKEMEKWLKKASEAGLAGTSRELMKIIKLSEEINRHILKARNELNKFARKGKPDIIQEGKEKAENNKVNHLHEPI